MRIVARRGLTVSLAGAPIQEVGADPVASHVGVMGADYPVMRTELLVEEGQSVEPGTALFRDRNRPRIVVTSPVFGEVEQISIGHRRRLSALTIALGEDSGGEPIRFPPGQAATPAGLRTFLLESGLWPALRTRPFERIPDPDGVADALFITAIDTAPHAPDPRIVLADRAEDFARGVEALTLLTEGPLFVCQDSGPALLEGLPERVSLVRFAGAHPAGLVGTHIARLRPVDGQGTVWHIGYQDVAALGRALASGKLDPVRTIAISGPGLRSARLVRAPLGVDLHGLLRSEITAGAKRIISGPILSGRESRYLARYHQQVTVLDRVEPRRRHWLLGALRQAAAPAPFIPTQALEQSFGPNLPLVPLLRALSIEDAQTCERLGCKALAEEDLALASYASGGSTDFGARLRAVLDRIEEPA
ncbi:hypothetical protein [Pelagibacterium montanilacus]|uniref:hypothetical protein n=1 Tax=Pelagibacterium montanilacus TaxID=2185280 RepID=UPI000F8EB700|nr:hypothetical protein [Pelagibacterium montanilacus]